MGILIYNFVYECFKFPLKESFIQVCFCAIHHFNNIKSLYKAVHNFSICTVLKQQMCLSRFLLFHSVTCWLSCHMNKRLLGDRWVSTWQDRLLLCDQNVRSAVSGTRRSQCSSFQITQNPAEQSIREPVRVAPLALSPRTLAREWDLSACVWRREKRMLWCDNDEENECHNCILFSE